MPGPMRVTDLREMKDVVTWPDLAGAVSIARHRDQPFVFAVPAGAIIGLLLLLVFLISRGQVGEPLNLAASSLLRYLPLLLVPPAVGVMVYATDIAADFWAIVGALFLSLLLSMAFAGVLMQRLVKRHVHPEDSQ